MTVFPLMCGAVGNEWIFYSNPNDIGRLYKQREDGTGITRLSLQSADNDNIEILGGWVYHIDSGMPYRTKTDGSVTEKLSDITGCYGVYLDNGSIHIPFLYCVNDAESLRVKFSGILTYNSKGYAGVDILCAFAEYKELSCSCIEADGGYVYFSYGDNKYYRYRPEYSGDIGDMYDEFWCENTEKYFNNKAVRIGTLPQNIIDKSERQAPKISNEDFFRSKYLCWESVDGAGKYVIYRKNPVNGKYKKLTETKNTSVGLTVLDSQYNDEYKVSAIRGSAKYKVRMTSPAYTLGNTGGNISNGAFAAEYDGVHYVCLPDGIYKLDGESKVKLFDGAADNISIAGGQIYFCEAVERINIIGDTIYLRAYDGRVFSCKTDGSGFAEL